MKNLNSLALTCEEPNIAEPLSQACQTQTEVWVRKIKLISKNFVSGPQVIEYSKFFFVFSMFSPCLLVSIEFSVYFSSY